MLIYSEKETVSEPTVPPTSSLCGLWRVCKPVKAHWLDSYIISQSYFQPLLISSCSDKGTFIFPMYLISGGWSPGRGPPRGHSSVINPWVLLQNTTGLNRPSRVTGQPLIAALKHAHTDRVTHTCKHANKHAHTYTCQMLKTASGGAQGESSLFRLRALKTRDAAWSWPPPPSAVSWGFFLLLWNKFNIRMKKIMGEETVMHYCKKHVFKVKDFIQTHFSTKNTWS